MSPARTRWAWLAELLEQQARPASVPAEGARPAISDALTRLGWPVATLVEGLAAVLDVTPTRLEHPDAATVARVDPTRLALVLAPLLADPEPVLARIATAWLSCRSTAYQIPVAHLEAWLARRGTASEIVGPRLAAEGLALLGDASLRRLAATAEDPDVAAAAQGWVDRFA